MSMICRFVEVSPDLLARLRSEPDEIPGLFHASLNFPRIDMNDATRDLWQARLQKLLEPSLPNMPQDVLDALKQRLGVTPETVRSGTAAETLLSRMAQSGLLSGVFSGGGRPAVPIEGKRNDLSIEKAWHGVHYLLSGEVEPTSDLPSQAILGGTEIGEDEGYGPARYFDPHTVASIAAALGREDLEQEMAARYDPRRMSQIGIYPRGWDDGGLEWLLTEFRHVREFYRDASGRGDAIVTCLV